MMPEPTDRLYTLPEAIARFQGYWVKGSRAQRCNNPGNINYGTFAKEHGATGVEPDGHTFKGRFAVFPDEDTGFHALRALLLSTAYKDLTIRQAINRYAPAADDNNPDQYVSAVCKWVGCSPDQTVFDVMTRSA